MKLSIIVPVYNEINCIEHSIKRILDAEYDKEVIIVDDKSTDGTREFLKRHVESNCAVKVLYHDINKGKTAAIRTALSEVTGDIIIIQDSDLEYNPSDYKQLMAPIVSGECNVVYGSRFLNERSFVRQWFLYKFLGRDKEIRALSHYLGILFLNSLANLLYGTEVTDIATGYKVFKADILKNIQLDSDRFEFCYEVTAKMARENIKIKEVPINYHARSKLEGKKITWKDGLWATWTLIKYRMNNNG